MAQTIDKYVLETSVTGMKDVDALNTSVTTLGKSIDTVTAKKISMTINATGFDDLNTKIGNINTSLNTLANKTAKPSVNIAGLDQLNLTMRSIASSMSQLNANSVNIQVNDSDVNRAKSDVASLNDQINKTNNNDISIDTTKGPGSLVDQVRNLGGIFTSGPFTAAAAALGTAAVAISAFVGNTVNAAGALKDLSDASGMSTSELLSLKDAMIDAGGGAEDAEKFVNKLMLSINEAADGNDKAIQTFKDLNVPIKEANGEMRDTSEIAADVIEALGGITDQATRQKLATDLLGKSLMGLDYKSIEFTDNATLNNQIDKTDKIGASWDKVSASLSKLSFSSVSNSADTLSRFLDDLNTRITQFNNLINDAPKWLDLFGEGAKKLFLNLNPVGAIINAIGSDTSWLMGKIKDLYTLMTNTPKDGLALTQGYRGKGFTDPRIAAAQNLPPIPSNEKPPKPTFLDSQFGTSSKAGSDAKSAADAAAREAEARRKARFEIDQQYDSLRRVQELEKKIADDQVSKYTYTKSQQAFQDEIRSKGIIRSMNTDILKLDQEIAQEKFKGKDADQYIINNLEKQKTLLNETKIYRDQQLDAEILARDQLKASTSALEDKYNAALKVYDLSTSESPKNAIETEISNQQSLVQRYTEHYEALKLIGEENGLLSETYLTAKTAFDEYHDNYLTKLSEQQALIAQLKQAEKDRAESFAGGWDDAMKRMVESFTPAQNGAKAFNDLWKNIETSIDSSITTGRFKFAEFRDAVIKDIAAMMFKAAASNLIGRILGTVVSAAVAPGSSSIPGDRGGSALPRAGGGSVSGGQPYMVGERGPELFMPGENGTIIPNRNLTAETKPTQVVNNYYNVSAVDGQSVARFFLDNRNMVAAANRQASKERS